jgi:hypothetical protein
MTRHGGNLTRSLITMAVLLAFFWLGASHPAAAQGRGNGNGGGGGGGGATGWIEQFSDALIENRGWGIEQTGSPDSLFGVPGTGLAKSFERNNVSFPNGTIRLTLSLRDESGTLTSRGALVYTKALYSYGTYEWCARMSSTADLPSGAGSLASGGISAGFVYVNNSQTEIDFELARSGSLDWWLYMANWSGLRRLTSSAEPATASAPNDFHAGFKIYKFVWTKDYIEFFVNDRSLAFHTANVPRTSAYVIMNHWGTNSPSGFGGPADTSKPDRYFFVDWARYTPQFGLPVGGTVSCGP